MGPFGGAHRASPKRVFAADSGWSSRPVATSPPVRCRAMDVAALLAAHDAEQVVFGHDERTGMRAIVALHSTALGPGLGGTRFLAYPTEEAALVDVLRLARGMTYKHAVCGNDLGGGKAVLLGDPRVVRTPEMIRRYAAFLDSLAGRYLT